MRLTAFRVTNFRSVEDSGWIDVSDITSLIGTNESGKTNLLLPLWKLNPAMEGKIDILADAPRKRFNEIRAMEDKPVFIRARFELEDGLVQELAEEANCTLTDVQVAEVSRTLGGEYQVDFPNANPIRTACRSTLANALNVAMQDIEAMEPIANADITLKEATLNAISTAVGKLDGADTVDSHSLARLKQDLESVDPSSGAKRSVIGPRFGQLLDLISDSLARISVPHPASNQSACKLVQDNLPSFVYYSNYGNLDSEIYLPHVIENLKRKNLGAKEEARARTLRVLFSFVRLEAEEILELGRDFPISDGTPTEKEIEAIAEKKRTRTILLQSASSELTESFRTWWKQGDYRIRFHADGDHFKIWVSDDRRPEEIELEGRSTGLQWFLSFYLIFLVESESSHRGAVLLLDEPGLSLHPIAQRDLSDFFENLATVNQIAYTTHSPFMVDPNHLDRVKAVYVDERGATAVSADLRAGTKDQAQSQSIYPVHAALGLSVSDVLMVGCQPVIVEGPSDQLYLSAIKNYLIRHGHITPKHELLFVPASGVKSVKAYAGLFTARDEAVPFIVLDSDHAGSQFQRNLEKDLYRGNEDRVVSVGELLGLPNAEIEDLIPSDLLARVMARQFRAHDGDDFNEIMDSGLPIVPQFEEFAGREGIVLHEGWKVDIARAAKERLQRDNSSLDSQPNLLSLWIALFEKFDR